LKYHDLLDEESYCVKFKFKNDKNEHKINAIQLVLHYIELLIPSTLLLDSDDNNKNKQNCNDVYTSKNAFLRNISEKDLFKRIEHTLYMTNMGIKEITLKIKYIYKKYTKRLSGYLNRIDYLSSFQEDLKLIRNKYLHIKQLPKKQKKCLVLIFFLLKISKGTSTDYDRCAIKNSSGFFWIVYLGIVVHVHLIIKL